MPRRKALSKAPSHGHSVKRAQLNRRFNFSFRAEQSLYGRYGRCIMAIALTIHKSFPDKVGV